MPTTRATTRKGESDASESTTTTENKRKAENKVEKDIKKRQKSEDPASTKKNNRKSANGPTIQESSERASEIPTNIVEKGIVYFITRGRVETENPEDVSDLQRSYMVLRPLPKAAEIGEGVIPDDPVSRLIAIPKKTLPKSDNDKFMIFVEKSKAKMADLKGEFFEGYEKETKTMGTRKTPPITVVGEGVYAITHTERTSHLAYILTIPSEPGEVQTDLGVRGKGSFVISLKNPTIKGPQNAQLPESPNFPKSILDEFRGLRWIPVQKPDHLNYENAQLLLIGEGQEDFGNALAKDKADEKNSQKESPEEELEKLENEEEIRIEHLRGDSSVFDDLHIRQKDYPPLKSTW